MSVTLRQPKSRRARAKAATRAKLLAAARACFDEHGYAGTQIGQISKAAGVAHGTFYVHFASKEEVLDELLHQTNERLRSALAPALLADAPFAERVTRAAEVFLDFCDRERRFIESYAQRLGQRASLELLRDGINPEVRGLLEQLIPEGARADVDWSLVVHGLLALWIRVGLHYLFDKEVADRAQVVRTLTALTTGGVMAAMEV